MALNIKNEETVALVTELAALTGESKTRAIEGAVRERLGTLRESAAEHAVMDRISQQARVDDLLQEIWAANRESPLPSRERIDAEMYDEWGLPR